MQNYFPNANFQGQIYNVNGTLYLVRGPIEFENFNGEIEYGWDANNLNNKCSYHFFTESEIKENNYTIQEY